MKTNPTMLRQLLEANFNAVAAKHRGDEFCIICPDCDDKSGHRSVNLKTGATNCFLCHKGGHISRWLKQHGVDVDEVESAVTATGDWMEMFERLDNVCPRRTTLRGWTADAKLPRGFTPLARIRPQPGKPENIYFTLIADMAARKHLDVEDLIAAGAGFTMDDPKWEPYCIFPVKAYGDLRYYQGRTYTDKPDLPTKRFPSKEYFPEGMTAHLYGFDEMRQDSCQRIIVVESILNVLSLRKKLAALGWHDVQPVCCWHSNVSATHWWLIGRNKQLKEVCIMFDHDAAAKAWKAADKFLSEHTPRFKVSIAEMPATCGRTTDPNDDVEAAIRACESRRQFSQLGYATALLEASL